MACLTVTGISTAMAIGASLAVLAEPVAGGHWHSGWRWPYDDGPCSLNHHWHDGFLQLEVELMAQSGSTASTLSVGNHLFPCTT
jgi:hypothetical protein